MIIIGMNGWMEMKRENVLDKWRERGEMTDDARKMCFAAAVSSSCPSVVVVLSCSPLLTPSQVNFNSLINKEGRRRRGGQ